MTTNIYLEQLARKNNIDLDYILFKDELSKIPYRPNLDIILNMSSSNHTGTHWVALHSTNLDSLKNPRAANSLQPNSLIIYFDSFGEIPPEEVIMFATNNNCKIVYNDYIIQHLSDIDCGQLSILFLGLCQDKFKIG